MTNYEKKDFIKDKEYYIDKCVILLQRYVRGFILRYFLYRSLFRNNMPKNKHLRSIYSIWKIKEITNNIVKSIDKKNKNVNKMIEKIDEENKAALKIREKLNKENEKLDNIKIKGINNEEGDMWFRIMQDIKKRGDDICPICFVKMWNSQVYLTSCSHCFHKNCLESFEKYDNYYQKRCPCCRQGYEKRLMKLI